MFHDRFIQNQGGGWGGGSTNENSYRIIIYMYMYITTCLHVTCMLFSAHGDSMLKLVRYTMTQLLSVVERSQEIQPLLAVNEL